MHISIDHEFSERPPTRRSGKPVMPAEELTDVRSPPGSLDARAVMFLQGRAGNAAVASLLSARYRQPGLPKADGAASQRSARGENVMQDEFSATESALTESEALEPVTDSVDGEESAAGRLTPNRPTQSPSVAQAVETDNNQPAGTETAATSSEASDAGPIDRAPPLRTGPQGEPTNAVNEAESATERGTTIAAPEHGAASARAHPTTPGALVSAPRMADGAVHVEDHPTPPADVQAAVHQDGRAATRVTAHADPHAPVRTHAPSGSHGSAGGQLVARGGALPVHADAGRSAAPASDLDKWKASVASTTAAIPDPQLAQSAAAAGQLAQHATTTEQQRKAEQPDYLQDARGRLPATPQEPPREKQLDTGPADAAVKSLDAVGSAKLPDQTFPPMAPLPVYTGAPGSSSDAGGSSQPLPPAPAADAKVTGPAVTPGGPADPQADVIKGKVAAAAPTTAGQVPGEAVTLQDKGAASLQPSPPGKAAAIGDAVARVLQDVERYAQEIVDTASAKLDPAKTVPGLARLTKPLVATQQDELTTELNGVAAAAGVSQEELAAKVEKQKADAAAKAAQAAGALDTVSGQAKADVTKRGADQTAVIGGASAAVADEVDRKQEAATGEPDAAAIDRKRDSYLEQVNEISAQGLARYRSSVETRAADLDRVGGEQKAAYRQRARAEAERIKALFPNDAIKGKIESRPVLDWGDQQALEVDGVVARLKREAAAASARLQGPLNDAAQQARNQIRDWAASKKGTQRSWWDTLLDMFKDWTAKAKADNKAWETQRNAETRNKVAGDFDMLVRLRDDLAAGNQEAFNAEVSRLSKEQRAVVVAFMKSGGKDSIGAVAVGLIERIKARRVPEFSKSLEDKAIAELEWDELNQLGAAQSPGFDAGLIIRDVRGSVKGWGTDENRLFKALQGRTPVQVAALRKAYKKTYDRDMDDDIKDDLSGSEKDRAEAYLSGDKTAGDIATLRDAMSGAGTDEELIMQTLRGKTPAERDAIVVVYKEKYGVELKADLKSEMDDNDRDQADALLAGDTTKADAIAINEAMGGIGTDEKGINAVYTRIRDEVEADAKQKKMTTAEVNAEIERRTGALKRAYGAKYGGDDPKKLEADFRDELSGGELNLVLAEQANDQTAMDAAKIQIEHESIVYTDDDKVNAVLIAQHDRAQKEIMRDLEIDFAENAKNMSPEERKKAHAAMVEQAKGSIDARAKQNMTALKDRYDAENPDFGFQAVMDVELQGYSHDEALERIEAGGKLDDAHELKYSIFGPGTNEDRIKETLKGKSKADVDRIKADYKALTGNDLAMDIQGDMSGRDLADTNALLEGTSTPAEKMAYLKKRADWELNEGTGILGEAADNEEEAVLEHSSASAQAAYDHYVDLKNQYGENDPKTQAALEDFERWAGYGNKDIEEHRAALDSITDTVAAGVAVVAGVAVSVLTAGVAAGPAMMAAAAWLGTTTTVVAAAAGAVAATAASMLTKELMKGGAYDAESIAVDLAQGTVEALAAVATAGVGEAALKALLKSPAFAAMKEAAESGALAKLVTKGVEGGIEGAVQGLPSGMAGAILNENTWKSDNAAIGIFSAGAHGSLQGAGMGAAMGAGMEAFGPKGHAGTRGEVEGPAGATGEEHAGPPGDSATPTADHAGAGDSPVAIDPATVGDQGAAGALDQSRHAVADEGARVGGDDAARAPAEDPGAGAKREPQAPRAADDPHAAPADEVHGPDTEKTAVDEAPDTEKTAVDEAPKSEPATERIAPEDTVDMTEMVMQGPNPKDPAEAQLMYENARAEFPDKEFAIYRNNESGEYIVIQGSEKTVTVDGGQAPREAGQHQKWKEILEGVDVGRWELQAHSHPAEASGVVDPVNQYPSGANGDMGAMVTEALNSGEARSSRIDYTTAEGANHTDYGFDPKNEKPYWIDVPDGAGGRRAQRFKTMESYHDFIENTIGAPSQGDIPPHMSGSSPKGVAAEPVSPGAAKASKSTSELHQEIKEAIKKANEDPALHARQCLGMCIALQSSLGEGGLVSFTPKGRAAPGKESFLPTREGIPSNWDNHVVLELEDGRVVDPRQDKVYNSLDDLRQDIFTAPVEELRLDPPVSTEPATAATGEESSFSEVTDELGLDKPVKE